MPMFSLFWCQELKKPFKWTVKHVNHLITSLVDWFKPCWAYHNPDKRRELPAVRDYSAERFPQQLSLLECQYVCVLLSEIGAILKHCQLWTPLPALWHVDITARNDEDFWGSALIFSRSVKQREYICWRILCLYTHFLAIIYSTG